jgi:CspA family cold shock protein
MWDGPASSVFFEEALGMPEGRIKKLTDKGFGFIETGESKDLFFHMSNLEGVRYEDLREGQRVSYNPGHGPKGPRAENVRPI